MFEVKTYFTPATSCPAKKMYEMLLKIENEREIVIYSLILYNQNILQHLESIAQSGKIAQSAKICNFIAPTCRRAIKYRS